MKYEEITKQIIGAVYQVYNQMGFGFLESVYQNCLMIELDKSGIDARVQYPIKAFYDVKIVGDFIADIVVEDCVILELKSVRRLHKMHEVQLVNYLTVTGLDVGLLINFGQSRAEIKRKVRELPS